MSEIMLEKRPPEERWFEEQFGCKLKEASISTLLYAMACVTQKFDTDCSCSFREQEMLLKEGQRRDDLNRKRKTQRSGQNSKE